MANAWGNAWGTSWGDSWNASVAPVVESARGGDDAFHHRGWDKQQWLRKQQREAELERTIAATYQAMLGVKPVAQVVQELAAEVVQEAALPVYQSPDYSGLSEWLAAQQAIVESIIARRLQEQEQDDEEALLLLI